MSQEYHAGQPEEPQDPIEPTQPEPEPEPVLDSPPEGQPPETEAEPAQPSATQGVPATECPNADCRFDKHEQGANFCILCGTLLYTHCGNCLARAQQYAKFCQYCGSDLRELRDAIHADNV